MNKNKIINRVALFSHSSWKGGAETAFINLVSLVTASGYEPIVYLPSSKGELVDFFKSIAVKTFFFNKTSIYGNTSNALLEFSAKDLGEIKDSLLKEKCDLVISNSSTYLEGAVAAAELRLPHIWSIHEAQEHNPDQPRGGVADGAFARWFAALSDHHIFCSHSTRVAHEAVLSFTPNATVLPPFLESASDQTLRRLRDSNSNVVNLMFIGAPTVRKNPLVAIELLAALRARGKNVYLNFLGGRRDHTGLIEGLLKRRNLKSYVNFLGKVDDPYKYFRGKAINVICAISEPFGLTVPESLSRGFPVIAPNSDGPSETLDPKYQYDLNDLDKCVRLVEAIIEGYEIASQDALKNYQRSRHRFLKDYQVNLISFAIKDALANYRHKEIPFELTRSMLAKAVNPDFLDQENVISSISIATGIDQKLILAKVREEQALPGNAVAADMAIFDVVPYQKSSQMSNLYRLGISFAIELAANYNDVARMKMTAFILVRLCTERARLGRNLKVLTVGDGIGTNSICLASAGFDVDYMYCEASLTSKVAAESFKKFQSVDSEAKGVLRIVGRDEDLGGSYDAVISLEVMAHVEEPLGFLSFLQAQLSSNGLLFLSDFLSGIKHYRQTHLISNERLGGLIPLMAAQNGLLFKGFCHESLHKSYVFQKSSAPIEQIVASVLNESSVIEMLIYEQAKLVKMRAGKIDKLIYIYKRALINLKGYFARHRLCVY
jgi:glycosyltransferase involved in cell wall biosynthesis/2-polyprenyl-3-methyl-5-hydroxy-6-metoxy-1,4-benzoquinol methylase